MISAGFLTLTFLCFLPAFTRIWESIKDLGLSVAYSFQELFNLDLGIVPTINELSSVPYTSILLPETPEEFSASWDKYWTIFFNFDNFFFSF